MKGEKPKLPELECDLVMRGGITSGLVYPAAVGEIAAHYRLRAIGGTSAGALAAAAAAAMEYGRTSGRNPRSLTMIRGIAARLAEQEGGTTLLGRLFEPDLATAPLMEVARPLLAGRLPSFSSPVVRRLLLRLVAGPLLAASAVVFLLGLVLLSRDPPQTPGGWLQAILTLVFLILLGALGIAFIRRRALAARFKVLVDELLEPLSRNHIGFSSGWRPAGEGQSVIQWAHTTIQELAGLPAEEPLTFGHLWDAAAARSGSQEPRREIDLKFIATDVSRRLLLQLPFLHDSLFARRSDLDKLLPPEVVDWICDRQGNATLDHVDEVADRHDHVCLPDARHFPVLLAARLSMSFPLLFSAVPLHVLVPGPGNRKRLIEVWLADGGITSNFPVHLFDAYVPKHPTFCLNLVYQDVRLFADEGPVDEPSRYLRLPGGENGDDGFLYMPNDGPGDAHFFTRLKGEKEGAAKRIGQFLGLVFDTSLAWNDNLVMDVPGYRDRIIHIWMDRGDGGFNFDMTPDQIMELDRKGRVAGRIIAERFLPGQYDDPLRPGTPLILGWLNHRRDRLATFLDARTSMEARFADQMELVKDLSRQDLHPTASEPAGVGEGEAHQAPRRRLALRMRPLLDSDPRATRPNKAGSTRRPS